MIGRKNRIYCRESRSESREGEEGHWSRSLHGKLISVRARDGIMQAKVEVSVRAQEWPYSESFLKTG